MCRVQKEGPKVLVRANKLVRMDDQDSSSDEASVREEQAKPPEREADRKAQSAAQAATEELRNALQTKGEQAKFGPGYVPGDDD
jgi:hypothetical protein